MQFGLSEEQEMIVSTVSGFVENEVFPHEAEVERTGHDPREIGEALDVATLLEGTVQRAGDQLRIRLRLFEAASGETLWVESFDRSFSVEEIFAVQSEIASRVADSLDAQLMAVSARAAVELPTENMEAY